MGNRIANVIEVLEKIRKLQAKIFCQVLFRLSTQRREIEKSKNQDNEAGSLPIQCFLTQLGA